MPAPRPHLRIDQLEDRTVPATLTVNSNLDTVVADAVLTLREAVAIVNAGNTTGRSAQEIAQISGALGSSDTIQFSSTLNNQSIALTGARLEVSRSVVIDGPGADKLTLDGQNGRQLAFIDGRTNGTINVTLRGLTLRDGNANGATGGAVSPGIDNSIRGGAIFNDAATVVVDRSHLTSNFAAFGGGLYNFQGTLTVQNSTLFENSVSGAGGAINSNGGAFNLIQSTVSGNSAETFSGGIVSNSTTNVVQSTIVSNQVVNAGAGDIGGGMYVSGGTAAMKNTLVAGNISLNNPTLGASDLGGNNLANGNNNLIGSPTSGGLVHGVNGNIVANSQLATSAFVSPLALNGGTVPNHQPLANGFVTDVGNDADAPFTTDQRGGVRILDNDGAFDGERVDIGAVEGTYRTGPFVVDSIADLDDGDYSAGKLSLREAVRLSNESAVADTISFAPGIVNIVLTAGELSINSGTAKTTISGGNGGVAISRSTAGGTPQFRIFSVSGNADFANLTIRNGAAADGFGGAGIRVFSGTVAISSSTISNNASSDNGGGIVIFGGTLNLSNSTVSGNAATGIGGGISIQGGTANMRNSTVTNNTADSNSNDTSPSGGGLVVFTGFPGGAASLFNTIVAGNFFRNSGTADDILDAQSRITGSNNFIGGNPLLGPLQSNGGATFTHLPAAGSPVIDAGSNAAIPLGITADQRGSARINGAAVEIGSVEVVPLALPTSIIFGGSSDGRATELFPDSNGVFDPSTPVITPAGIFPGYNGAVRTTTGDVNNDGITDAIIVTGPGTPIRYAVISGTDGITPLVPATDPFGGDFLGGGFVSSIDIDGDSRAEIVITPDQGGGPRVSIFSLNVNGSVSTRANFFGIDDPNFRGGARAALGDVNKDGMPDLIVCAGFLGGPRTSLFNGSTLFTSPTRLIGDFFAFPGTDAITLRNGVFVAAGDMNGDGFADLIFGGGPGGGPRVFILSGAQVSANNVDGAQAAPIANFFVANNSTDRGGIRVATTNADGDSMADLVTGSGEGSPANVRIYRGSNFTSSSEPANFQNIAVFGGVSLLGGVFVG